MMLGSMQMSREEAIAFFEGAIKEFVLKGQEAKDQGNQAMVDAYGDLWWSAKDNLKAIQEAPDEAFPVVIG